MAKQKKIENLYTDVIIKEQDDYVLIERTYNVDVKRKVKDKIEDIEEGTKIKIWRKKDV